jgi:hypothetical protein
VWYNALVYQVSREENPVKSLEEVIRSLLSQPTADDLVALQGALLASGQRSEAVDRALDVAGHFFSYLSELQSKIAAKDYSELASRLDIGAVGVVALENIVVGERESFWKQLLLGGLGEGLMVAASRQYVRGWEVETGLVHREAAWYLAEVLWYASCEMQPDLPAEERWQAIEVLLAPAHDPEVAGPAKALLLGHVFQMLLLTYLAGVMGADARD